MIKILTPNKDGKIELTKEELEELLNEAKKEGKEEERNRPKGEEELSNRTITTSEPYSLWDNMPIPKAEKVWYDKLGQEERNKMFYVDYDNLPNYYDNNLYEKAPYWMNPKFKMPPVTCKPIYKYENSNTTAEPNPNLWNSPTSISNNIAEAPISSAAEKPNIAKSVTHHCCKKQVDKYAKVDCEL